MDIVLSLVTGALIIAFILAAFVYMFSPQRGADLLKRLAVLLFVTSFGMSVIASLVRSLAGGLWFPMLLLALIAVAYFNREARLGQKGKEPARHFGAERIPIMPNGPGKEDE
jgi:hypothetical protein